MILISQLVFYPLAFKDRVIHFKVELVSTLGLCRYIQEENCIEHDARVQLTIHHLEIDKLLLFSFTH